MNIARKSNLERLLKAKKSPYTTQYIYLHKYQFVMCIGK